MCCIPTENSDLYKSGWPKYLVQLSGSMQETCHIVSILKDVGEILINKISELSMQSNEIPSGHFSSKRNYSFYRWKLALHKKGSGPG